MGLKAKLMDALFERVNQVIAICYAYHVSHPFGEISPMAYADVVRSALKDFDSLPDEIKQGIRRYEDYMKGDR